MRNFEAPEDGSPTRHDTSLAGLQLPYAGIDPVGNTPPPGPWF